MADRDPQIGRALELPAYEADYAAWVASQAALLGERRYTELDLLNLVDEVESLGRSEYASFVGAIEIVLVHMLKWATQPARRTPSWVASIVEHRRRISQSPHDNPSFKSRIADAVERAFRTATNKAAGETNLSLTAFPDTNLFDWEAITTRPYHLPA